MKIINRIVVLFLIGTLTGVLALGKTTKRKVLFNNDLTVDGTLVKKGTYDVSFNEETGELTIKRGKKVLAKVQARLEKTDYRYSLYTRTDPKDPTQLPVLLSVSFEDGNQATIVDKGDKSSVSARP